MKINKISVVLIGIILIFAISLGYFWADGKAKTRLMKEVTKEKQSQINALSNNINSLKEIADIQGAQIVEARQDLLDLRSEMKIRDREHEKELIDLEKAPPEILISEAQRIVDTEEIWQRDNEIVFSLSAFKKTTVKLFDGEYCRLTKVKDLENQLAKAFETIVKQAEENGILKIIIEKSDERFKIQDLLVKDYQGFIRQQKSLSFFNGLIKFGLGGVTGFTIGYVAGK